MFSDYTDYSIAIETNNVYNKYDKNYIRSKFNKKIDLSNNINLTYLTFENNFNKKWIYQIILI